MWHTQFLSRCVEVMSQDESIVLCNPQAMWIDTDSQPLGIIPGSVETRGLDTISRVNVVLWGLGYCYPVYGLIKLSALRQATLGLKNNWSRYPFVGRIVFIWNFCSYSTAIAIY